MGLGINWITNFAVGVSFKVRCYILPPSTDARQPLNKFCTHAFGEGSVFFLFAAISALMTYSIAQMYKPTSTSVS
jgi:hypothetical protein